MSDWSTSYQLLMQGTADGARRRQARAALAAQNAENQNLMGYRSKLLDLQGAQLKAAEASRKQQQDLDERRLALDADKQLGDQYNAYVKALGAVEAPSVPRPPEFFSMPDAQGNPTQFLRTYKPDGAWSDSVYEPKPPENKASERKLTAEEMKRLGAVRQAGSNVDYLAKFYGLQPAGDGGYEPIPGADVNWGGPLMGRLKPWLSAFTGHSASPSYAARHSNARGLVTAMVPNLARGVFGEVGELTAADQRRYEALVPTEYDTMAQRAAKLRLLQDYLASTTAALDELYGTGPSGAPAAPQQPVPRFDTLEEARSAGATVAEVFDPGIGKWRMMKVD